MKMSIFKNVNTFFSLALNDSTIINSIPAINKHDCQTNNTKDSN